MLMYWSEVKHLLRYLIYNCDDPKTYISLALTCKYAAELAKYYAPMKTREFCRNIDGKYVLPNGRVIKEINEKYLGESYEMHYDIKNNISIQHEKKEPDDSIQLTYLVHDH